MWPLSTIKKLKAQKKSIEDSLQRSIESVEEANKAMEESNEEIDRISKCLDEAIKNNFTPETSSAFQNTINANLKGGAIQLIAEALAKQFDESNATNFITMEFTRQVDEPSFQVTLQRIDGESLADQLNRIKSELDEYKSKFGELPTT